MLFVHVIKSIQICRSEEVNKILIYQLILLRVSYLIPLNGLNLLVWSLIKFKMTSLNTNELPFVEKSLYTPTFEEVKLGIY